MTSVVRPFALDEHQLEYNVTNEKCPSSKRFQQEIGYTAIIGINNLTIRRSLSFLRLTSQCSVRHIMTSRSFRVLPFIKSISLYLCVFIVLYMSLYLCASLSPFLCLAPPASCLSFFQSALTQHNLLQIIDER